MTDFRSALNAQRASFDSAGEQRQKREEYVHAQAAADAQELVQFGKMIAEEYDCTVSAPAGPLHTNFGTGEFAVAYKIDVVFVFQKAKVGLIWRRERPEFWYTMQLEARRTTAMPDRPQFMVSGVAYFRSPNARASSSPTVVVEPPRSVRGHALYTASNSCWKTYLPKREFGETLAKILVIMEDGREIRRR
jgi:hypothetical protein